MVTTTRPARSEALSVRGYERVFGVLERVESASSRDELRELLVEAVPALYGARHASFFRGDRLDTAFDDPEPLSPGGDRERLIMEEYLVRWRREDVYASPTVLRRLDRDGVVLLAEQLPLIAERSSSYIRDFLAPRRLLGSVAVRVDLGAAGVGILGLFDPDPDRFGREDALGLRLLGRRLSAFARLLPAGRVDSDDLLAGVTGRPREVAWLVAAGLSNAAIARELCLAEDTVKKYVSRVLTATRCRSRTELALQLQAAPRTDHPHSCTDDAGEPALASNGRAEGADDARVGLSRHRGPETGRAAGAATGSG